MQLPDLRSAVDGSLTKGFPLFPLSAWSSKKDRAHSARSINTIVDIISITMLILYTKAGYFSCNNKYIRSVLY